MDDAVAERPLELEASRLEAIEVHVVGGPGMLVLEVDDLELAVQCRADVFGDFADLVARRSSTRVT